jgi:hypothetical protein
MMNFFSKKIKSKSEDIAQALLDEFISQKELYNHPYFNIDEKNKFIFENEISIYQKATLLVAILSKEENEPNFVKVRKSFESLIFSKSQEEELNNYSSIKEAMIKLKDLFYNKDCKRFTWARTWLENIGIQESNPASLAQFSLFWMNDFIAISDVLDRFDPK